MAELINTVFFDFDYAILAFFHSLVDTFGFILKPITDVVDVIGGGKTCVLTIIGMIIFLTSKDENTKKKGAAMFGATALCLFIINLLVKNVVDRARPFDTVDQFRIWWQYAGSLFVDDSSFPSGHTVAATAGVVGWLIVGENKKKAHYLLLLLPLLFGFTRLYAQVHYPSDVLFGFIFGVAIALLAKFICYILWKYFKKFMPFFDKLMVVVLIGYCLLAGFTFAQLFI